MLSGPNSETLEQLKNLITSKECLKKHLVLTDQEDQCFDQLSQSFKMSITPYYLGLIDTKDPNDPIRLQCIPQAGELIHHRNLSLEDPLAEDEHMPVPFLVHRYPDRVLFLLTEKCAVYCRHCTRKRWTAHDERPAAPHLDQMIEYIRNHPAIRDVLISGGDPLLAGIPRLLKVLEKLSEIPTLDIIRIGTRVPVVLPMMIDDSLAQALGKTKPLYINTHFNHPREVTPEACAALNRLADAGIICGNQTVLLRGINDRAEILEELFRKLLKNRCRPYYLLQCDPVHGTEHFRTPIQLGAELIYQLRGKLTGLAIPKFVIDLPGGGGKVEYTIDPIKEKTAQGWKIENSQGNTYTYPVSSMSYL